MAIHDSNTGAKGTLYRGNYEPAEWSIGDKKVMGWKEETQTGTAMTFEDTYNDKVLAAKVKGNSVQKSEWQNKEADSSQVQTTQGKNLFDISCIVGTYTNTVCELTIGADGIYTLTPFEGVTNTGIYITVPIPIEHQKQYNAGTYKASYKNISVTSQANYNLIAYVAKMGTSTIERGTGAITFDEPFTITGIIFYFRAGTNSEPIESGQQVIRSEYQFELGSVSTAYEPFVPDSPSPDYPQPITTTIPAGTYRIQDWKGDWYEFTLPRDLHGIGDVRDSVEWDKYSHAGFLRETYNNVDLGDLTWGYATGANSRYVALVPNAKLVGINVVANALCTHYKVTTISNIYSHVQDYIIGVHYTLSQIWIYDTRFEGDTTAFKSAATGYKFVYQLATPTRTPLTFTLNNASTAPELPMDFLTDTPSADYPATIFSAEGEVTVKNSGGTELQSTSFPALRSVNDIKDEFDGLTGRVERKTARIESYAGESITTEYISSTGGLDTGATVIYELETPAIEQHTPIQLKTYPHTTVIEVTNETSAQANLTATVKTVDLN